MKDKDRRGDSAITCPKCGHRMVTSKEHFDRAERAPMPSVIVSARECWFPECKFAWIVRQDFGGPMRPRRTIAIRKLRKRIVLTGEGVRA